MARLSTSARALDGLNFGARAHRCAALGRTPRLLACSPDSSRAHRQPPSSCSLRWRRRRLFKSAFDPSAAIERAPTKHLCSRPLQLTRNLAMAAPLPLARLIATSACASIRARAARLARLTRVVLAATMAFHIAHTFAGARVRASSCAAALRRSLAHARARAQFFSLATKLATQRRRRQRVTSGNSGGGGIVCSPAATGCGAHRVRVRRRRR